MLAPFVLYTYPMNYFQGNKNHPQHLSVGAVLRNEAGMICVHHYPADLTKGYWHDVGVADFYTLMRETLEPNETLEGALMRGLKQEFNATATLDKYLGSIVSTVIHEGVPSQKTTLYFLCTLTDGAAEGWVNEDEGSALEWHPADFLIEKMTAQRTRFNRDDIDESAILKRLI